MKRGGWPHCLLEAALLIFSVVPFIMFAADLMKFRLGLTQSPPPDWWAISRDVFHDPSGALAMMVLIVFVAGLLRLVRKERFEG